MGSFCSRMKKFKSTVVIRDYNKVIIPKGYELINISTYNLNIKNSINITNRIDEIISYISSSFKNKNIDIFCFQGIHDYESAYNLISRVKIYMNETNERFYFAPEFDEVDSSGSIKKSNLGISWSSRINSNGPRSIAKINKARSRSKSRSISRELVKKIKVQNIIISKHPIVSTIFSELDKDTDLNDIIGTHTLLGANISISGNIISIYNTELSKDIRTANIINSDIRDKEISSILGIIQNNIVNLKKEEFVTYHKTDVHLLIGSLNINEFVINDWNEEYTRFIENTHCIDVFRYITDDNPGYTNSTRERLNYIFFILTEDLYDERSKYFNMLQELDSPNKLFNLIFNRYGIFFMDAQVRSDIYLNSDATNYPVECIFMIDKNKH